MKVFACKLRRVKTAFTSYNLNKPNLIMYIDLARVYKLLRNRNYKHNKTS